MKKLISVILLSVLLFASCSGVSETANENSSESVSAGTFLGASSPESEVSEEEFEISDEMVSSTVETSEPVSVYTEDVDLEAIGGAGIDWDYVLKYTTIPSSLIKYVGSDITSEWTDERGEQGFNLQLFIERFSLTIDEVLKVLNPPDINDGDEVTLTVSDIEVLCSGDQKAINETFVSEYAALSENGDIYTIFWLAEHDAEDYAAAGLSAEAVQKAIDNCKALEIDAVTEYAEKAEAQLLIYTGDIDLEARCGEDMGNDWDYDYRYYEISGNLIKYVGSESFQEWVNSGEKINMQKLVEKYKLSAGEIIDVLDAKETPEHKEDLSVHDIEVLCSGDQKAINETFVSEYAALSENGDIYTIFWLAEHDAEDYAAAGLSAEAVQKAIDNCKAWGVDVITEYAEKAETQAAELAALSETE